MGEGKRTVMIRVNKILEDKEYKEQLGRNEEAEKERIFCHHDMGHFLDVARIAMILNKKENYAIEEELIYAAALLHDIGRWMQYRDGIPHEQASADIAPGILINCGFDKEERDMILKAIRMHRNDDVKYEKNLSGLLYCADKLSRACFSCKAQEQCNWKKEKKNTCIVL